MAIRAPTLRDRLPAERLAFILAMPYPQRMRHLRILRYVAAWLRD